MEIYRLAEQACILKPSMTGVLVRMEAAGLVSRRKAEQDQRRVLVNLAARGEEIFASMSQCMESNYRRIQEQFGEQKLQALLGLLEELKQVGR
ncbi:transcriptional regulator SlyA [compost metagenome]